MNQNNNLNQGVEMNPSEPVQPNMGMNLNQSVQPSNVQSGKSKKGLIVGISIAATVAVVVLVVVVLLLFGGNKNKKLTCKQSQSLGMGMTMEAIVNFEFKSKKVNNAMMNVEVDLGNYISYKDTFIAQFEEEYKEFEEKGIDVKITSDTSKVYIKLEMDAAKMKEADITTFNTYDEVKSDMESQGFSCE